MWLSLRIFVSENHNPMTKQNYDITRMQREDLAKAYRDVYPKCWSQQEVWDKIAKHPAPRYYITAKEAYEKLRRMVTTSRSSATIRKDREGLHIWSIQDFVDLTVYVLPVWILPIRKYSNWLPVRYRL